MNRVRPAPGSTGTAPSSPAHPGATARWKIPPHRCRGALPTARRSRQRRRQGLQDKLQRWEDYVQLLSTTRPSTANSLRTCTPQDRTLSVTNLCQVHSGVSSGIAESGSEAKDARDQGAKSGNRQPGSCRATCACATHDHGPIRLCGVIFAGSGTRMQYGKSEEQNDGTRG